MGEKPPAWTRVDGEIGQAPLMLSRDVDSSNVHPSSGQSPSLMADQIVSRNQSAIARFVSVQRQAIEVGNKSIHNAMVPLDGMEVYYTHVQGLERMHYHVTPEAAPVISEVEVPEIPSIPSSPAVSEPELLNEVMQPPLETPELPEEAPKEPEPQSPEFLTVSIPVGLAVEFNNGDE